MTPGEVLDLKRSLYSYLEHPSEVTAVFYDQLYDTLEAVSRSGDPGQAKFARSTWIAWFYPAQQGRELLPLIRKPLFGAPVYTVTEDIVDAVTGMYRRTSEAQTVSFSASDLPSRTGFMRFDKPVVLRDVGGEYLSTRAISWGPVRVVAESGTIAKPGIRFTAWCHHGDEHAMLTDALPGAPLNLVSSQITPFGRELRRMHMRLEDGMLVDVRHGEGPDDLLYWVQTLWLFMQTEIVGTERPHIPRYFVRRARRFDDSDSVTVIQLRRVARHHGDEVGTRHVDWSCRWIVQAHYRHLEDYGSVAHSNGAVPKEGDPGHCAVCGRRISKQVRAYVKGPDGMPLKAVPETVYVVAR